MTKTLALVIWFAGIVGWCAIRQPYVRRSKKTAVRKSLVDLREWILLGLAAAGLFLLPALYAVTGFPGAFERPFVPMVAWLGVAALAAAIWLFWRSHADLGGNWSASLKLRSSHDLITTGVYRLVRHPMYSSFLLLGLAQLLLLPNWFAGLAGVTGAGALYVFRVAREEQMMIELFGESYRSYMARTRRIIPWLL
ncbi:MAG: protein-S-isoprenylcysteine O-methyltransferase [Pseudolabrys sp.]